MIALVFGEENSPKPTPSTTRQASMYHRAVDSERKTSRKRPRAVNAIPAEATICGSIRSESRPATGETTAMTAGWTIRISPAYSGEKPLVYWRSRLKRNVTAKVAL